ncbi:hypothetical protein JW962_03355 [Candidatus Dojkabacteria bacterium]|nr:hypothetical protein [Candidatus Dojkabacteria bacterium]
MLKHNQLFPIRRGLYGVTGKPIRKFELAVKICPDSYSYISFDTACYKHQLIYDWSGVITVASSRSFNFVYQNILYKGIKLRPDLLSYRTGIITVKSGSHSLYNIASPERAVVDTLYRYGDVEFDDLFTLNFYRCNNIAGGFGKKRLLVRLNKLEESVKRLLINRND